MIDRRRAGTDQFKAGKVTGNGVGNPIGELNIFCPKENIFALH